MSGGNWDWQSKRVGLRCGEGNIGKGDMEAVKGVELDEELWEDWH